MAKAKVSKNYHITIPKKIRLGLRLQPGDTVFFIQEGNRVFFTNAGKEPEIVKGKLIESEKSSFMVQRFRQEWKDKEKLLGL